MTEVFASTARQDPKIALTMIPVAVATLIVLFFIPIIGLILLIIVMGVGSYAAFAPVNYSISGEGIKVRLAMHKWAGIKSAAVENGKLAFKTGLSSFELALKDEDASKVRRLIAKYTK